MRLFRAFVVLGALWVVFFGAVAHAGADALASGSKYLAYHQRGGDPELKFALDAKKQAIADLMRQSPGQRRRLLRLNPILSQIAQERAEDMGRRGYFSHINPDGLGANHLVQQAGYLLPSSYGQSLSANNIETIAAGPATAEAVWSRWMNSASHQTHLLGLDGFWVEQTDYGIGYAFVAGSPYLHYWVVLTGRH